ncbi:hypothetical protein VTK26DRAFT_7051 [Humicola hyalothermophila]
MAVIDKQPLAKVVIAPHKRGPVVLLILGDRVHELARRRHQPVQHVHQRVPVLLARQAGPHDRLHAGRREDRLEDDRPDAVHHHDGVGVRRRHRLHQLVPVVPRVEVVAVALVALDVDVALARVGRDDDDGRVGARHGVGHAVGAVRAVQRQRGAVALGARAQRVVGGHEVRVLDGARAPAHAERALVAPLVHAGVHAARVGDGGGADEGEARRAAQRECVVVVLEQHDAVARDRPHVLPVVALHVGADVDGRVARVLAEEVPGREDALAHVVEAGARHLAAVDGAVELRAPQHVEAVVVAAGHRHVHAVVGRPVGRVLRVPVAHNVPGEPELRLEEAVLRLVVLASP